MVAPGHGHCRGEQMPESNVQINRPALEQLGSKLESANLNEQDRALLVTAFGLAGDAIASRSGAGATSPSLSTSLANVFEAGTSPLGPIGAGGSGTAFDANVMW
jgi:hypothetical protein